MIVCVMVVFPLVVGAAFVHWYYSRDSNSMGKRIRNFKRVLLVIAHPDDECLFFGPTILKLTKSAHCDFHLLCLSSGNHYKKGAQRKLELKVILSYLKFDTYTDTCSCLHFRVAAKYLGSKNIT